MSFSQSLHEALTNTKQIRRKEIQQLLSTQIGVCSLKIFIETTLKPLIIHEAIEIKKRPDCLNKREWTPLIFGINTIRQRSNQSA